MKDGSCRRNKFEILQNRFGKDISMSQNNDNYTKGFLIGALVGGAVGAVVALLTTPKSGRELRQDIAERSEGLYNKAQSLLQRTEEQTEEFVNEGKSRSEGIVNSARSRAEALMSNAEQVLRDARDRAQNLKESVAVGTAKVADAAKAGAQAFRSEIE